MSRPVLKKNLSLYLELIVFVYVALIMLLTSANISYFLTPKKVLGIKTVDSSAQKQSFWSTFLAKNPDYIPGLIEAGNNDRAKEIDPNYVMP